jgi:hypothetical protein
MLTVAELFRRASLKMCGPVPWGSPIAETSSGVYVIALVDPTIPFAEKLSNPELARWNFDEEIVYIGKATKLRKRLSQFYRHQYGRSSPHRGGQDILRFGAALKIYWAVVPDCAAAEHAMIDAFHSDIGALPFGNRVRGTRRRSFPS